MEIYVKQSGYKKTEIGEFDSVVMFLANHKKRCAVCRELFTESHLVVGFQKNRINTLMHENCYNGKTQINFRHFTSQEELTETK